MVKGFSVFLGAPAIARGNGGVTSIYSLGRGHYQPQPKPKEMDA